MKDIHIFLMVLLLTIHELLNSFHFKYITIYIMCTILLFSKSQWGSDSLAYTT